MKIRNFTNHWVLFTFTVLQRFGTGRRLNLFFIGPFLGLFYAPDLLGFQVHFVGSHVKFVSSILVHRWEILLLSAKKLRKGLEQRQIVVFYAGEQWRDEILVFGTVRKIVRFHQSWCSTTEIQWVLRGSIFGSGVFLNFK